MDKTPNRRTQKVGQKAGPTVSPSVLFRVFQRALLGLGLSFGFLAAASAAPPPKEPSCYERTELDRLGQALQKGQAAQRSAEAEAARDAREIERLKGMPEGVTRDLELQDRLARAQERAQALSRGAGDLRQLSVQLAKSRRKVLADCDRQLADPKASLSSAQRLEILRIRTSQAEALFGAERPHLLSEGAIPGALFDESDDPSVLRERADLLRDTADKVRAEVVRLSERSKEIVRRQKLRERIDAVDQDLFGEQMTSRGRSGAGRANAEASASKDTATPPRAPGEGGGVFGTPGTGMTPQAQVPAATRSNFDPATLDSLRRGEQSTDPEVRLLALQKASGELSKMLDQLNRRAKALELRADEISKRK